jgi:hypothetical protein
MSAHPKDGGPAFPCDPLEFHYGNPNGMSLRDYFAAKALPAVYADVCREMERHGCPGPDWRNGVAADCYAMANAMLKAREVGL